MNYPTSTASELGYASKGIDCAAEAQQAPIPESIATLGNRLRAAHESLSDLESRLGPVTEPPSPQVDKPGAGKIERGPVCDMHATLVNAGAMADTLTERIRSIYRRLAL